MAKEEVTTKLSLDISDLKASVQEASRQIKLANAEFKAASAGVEDWGKNTEVVAAKQKQLDTVIQNQTKILDSYKQQLQVIISEQGENSKAADNMRIKIANQEAAVKKTAAEIQKYDAVMNELQNAEKNADRATDELDESIDKVGRSVNSAGDGFTVLKGVLANLATTTIMAVVDGLKDLGTALIDVGKESISNYAKFEQLAGGVDTLFKAASDTVIKNANNAFKTAGLSANAYMETVTSFSASLIASTAKNTEKLSDEEVKIRQGALDKQVENQKKAAEQTYKAQKEAFEASYNATKKAYDKQYSELQKAYSKQYDEKKKSYDNEYAALQKSLENEVSEAEKSYDKRLDLLKAKQEAEVDAFTRATEKKIALIDKEYKENLKLVDEEQYNRIKAIDEQIEAINAESEAERKAQEKAEQEQKIAELKKAIYTAESAEDRKKARQELADYEAKIAQKEREEQRKTQLENLKSEKDSVKEQSEVKKEALKEQYENQVKTEKELAQNRIDELKKSNEAELKAFKEAQKTELEALKEAKQEKLSTLKESQSAELETMKETQSSELASMKESQSMQLESIKNSQSAQLEAVKEGSTQRLEILKNAAEEEKKLLASDDVLSDMAESLGVDYEKAAELADMAIKDMSDNANKMGTDIQSLQNAYQGFAKQSYVMLDNLKLGYGGTKQEMERLLADAEKLTGQKYDLSSFADVVEAIHAIQTEMDITGTTAKEASQTIEGSMGALKSSWENLLTGLAAGDEMDMEQLIGNLFDSLVNVGKNLVPRIKTLFDTAKEALGEFVSDIIPQIGDFLKKDAGELIKSGTSLFVEVVTGIVELAPDILSVLFEAIKGFASGLVETAPDFITAFYKVLYGIATSIIKELPNIYRKLFDEFPNFFKQFVENFMSFQGEVVKAATELFSAIGTSLPEVYKLVKDNLSDLIKTVITVLVDAAPEMLENSVTMFEGIVEAISEVIPEASSMLFELIDALVEALSDDEVSEGFFDALEKIITAVMEAMPPLIENLGNIFVKSMPILYKAFMTMLGGLLKGVPVVAKNLAKALPSLIKTILNAFDKNMSAMVTVGKNLITGLWNGIAGNAEWLKEKVTGFADSVVKNIKSALKIKSPSRVMRDEVGKYIALGIADGIESNSTSVKDAIKALTADATKLDFGIDKLSGRIVGSSSGMGGTVNNTNSTSNVTFNQYNTSPKALSRLDIYRQTNNLLTLKKGAFASV